MAKITLNIVDASASAQVEGKLTAGAVGIPVEVNISGERWAGLAPKLIARCRDLAVPMVIMDGMAEMPHECLIAGCTPELSVDGWDDAGTKRIPTMWARLAYVYSSAADAELTPPTPPTPDIVQQILAAAQLAGLRAGEAERLAKAIAEAAQRGDFDGKDGVSPTVSVTTIPGGHRVTVKDAEKIQYFDVLDGKDGKPGRDGADGAPGKDGADGKDYVLTAKDKQDIADLVPGYDDTEIKKDLAQKANNPANPVVGQWGRVKEIVDGQPVWETAELPIATAQNPGVIYKVGGSYGVGMNEAAGLYVVTTPNSLISVRASQSNQAVTLNKLDDCVKAAMCDGKGAAWDSVSQLAALARLGITVDDNGICHFG